MGFNINSSAPAIVVFVQGILSFFSPCILPLVPLYFAYLSGGVKEENGVREYDRVRAIVNTLFFVLGISATFFILGFGFTALGGFLSGHQLMFARISGIVMVFFGLYQLGFLGKSRILSSEKRVTLNTGKWAMGPIPAFILGFTFSFAWTPCVGPVLGSVLLMAGSSQAGGKAFLLIGLYTVGFVIPFVILSFFATTVLNLFKKHQNVVKYTVKIGGVLMIVMGLMTFTGVLNSFTGYINKNNQTAASSEEQTQSKPDNSTKPEEENTQGANPDKETQKGASAETENGTESSDGQKRTLRAAPDFELKDQYGNVHKLSDYKGKTVFLNFWATWCPPCRKEMPEINELYKELGENKNDVVILGVAGPNLGREGDTEHIKSFLEDAGYEFPVVMDESGEQFTNYGIRAFPTTFMITSDGEIYGNLEGGITKDIMKSIIEETKNYTK